MNRLSQRIKKPATLILKEVDFEDTIKRKVHKSGNKKNNYGKIYLPKEWVGRDVYVGLTIQNEKNKN